MPADPSISPYPDIEFLRQQFPLIATSPIAYLDNAATTQKPQCVLQAMDDYYRHANANVHRAAHQLSSEATRQFEQARLAVARFINAPQAEEIIWTRGTTEGINLVAASLGSLFKTGDRILLTAMEHHANIVPWQLLAKRHGLVIDVIPITANGELDLTAAATLLEQPTRLVALTHISNTLGTVNPIEKIIGMAKEAGAYTLIDGAQAVAHLPVDVQALGCDFYLFSGHKVYGPTGIGVLYGRYDLLTQLPPWQGGGEMIEQVSFSGSRFQPPPLRFEAGTPNISGAIGLAAALNFVASLDRKALFTHEQHLISHVVASLTDLGVQVMGDPDQRCGSVSFVVDGHHSLDIGSYLDQQQVAIRTGHHCCMPLMAALGIEGTARLSLACYTNQSDVDRALLAIQRYLQGEASTNCGSGRDKPDPSQTQGPLTAQVQQARSRDQRHTLIMKAGREPLSTDTTLHQPDYQLHGCTSKVWLRRATTSTPTHPVFEMDSDARVLRGLIRLLQEAISGMSTEQVQNIDLHQHFECLGLIQQLSPSRTSGLVAIIAAVKEAAHQS